MKAILTPSSMSVRPKACGPVRRNSAKATVEIHRLVQAVIKDGMEEIEQCTWVDRAVTSVQKVLVQPDPVLWGICEEDLPQARAAAELIELFDLKSDHASSVLLWLATYMRGRRLDAEAESFAERTIAMLEALSAPNEPKLANALNVLGLINCDRGQYAVAEGLFVRAIALDETVYGSEQPALATLLNSLSTVMAASSR